MNDNRVWNFTATGDKLHAFIGGHAICRKNLKDGSTRPVFKDEAMKLAGAHMGYTICASCVKKFDAMVARQEASMAAVNPYDQVCEGVETVEGQAQVASDDEPVIVARDEAEAVTLQPTGDKVVTLADAEASLVNELRAANLVDAQARAIRELRSEVAELRGALSEALRAAEAACEKLARYEASGPQEAVAEAANTFSQGVRVKGWDMNGRFRTGEVNGLDYGMTEDGRVYVGVTWDHREDPTLSDRRSRAFVEDLSLAE